MACGGLIDRTSGRNACVTYHSLWDSITGSAYLPHKGGRRVDDTLAVKGVERGRGVRGRVGVSPHPTLTYVRTDASPQPTKRNTAVLSGTVACDDVWRFITMVFTIH